MEHGQRFGAELVEPQRFAHRAPALVHIGRGLEQQDLFAADPAFLGPTEKLLLHRAKAMNLGHGV